MERERSCTVEARIARSLVSDNLSAMIEPRLPPERPEPKGGRLPISSRAALMGLLVVLKTGLPWAMLPPETGGGSARVSYA